MAKDKILISGGTGYVGTPLLKLLKKKYHIISNTIFSHYLYI